MQYLDKKVKYSLIIPCYNEAENLPQLIANCKKVLSIDGYEIIFVNNGSKDNSSSVFLDLTKDYNNIKIVEIENNIGYGDGILKGLMLATGDIIGWTHADNQTHPSDFIKAVDLFTKYKNLDFVKGNRYGRSFLDRIFSLGMGIFDSILLRVNLFEINAQPTVFKKEFMSSWESPPIDFSLDLYVYFKATKLNLKIKRIKVFFGPRLFGTSKWNTGINQRVKFIKRTIEYSFQLKKQLNGNNITQKK